MMLHVLQFLAQSVTAVNTVCNSLARAYRALFVQELPQCNLKRVIATFNKEARAIDVTVAFCREWYRQAPTSAFEFSPATLMQTLLRSKSKPLSALDEYTKAQTASPADLEFELAMYYEDLDGSGCQKEFCFVAYHDTPRVSFPPHVPGSAPTTCKSDPLGHAYFVAERVWNSEADVRDKLNMLAGPMFDFYQSVQGYRIAPSTYANVMKLTGPGTLTYYKRDNTDVVIQLGEPPGPKDWTQNFFSTYKAFS